MYSKIDNILFSQTFVSSRNCVKVDVIDNINNFCSYFAVNYCITFDAELLL